MDIISFNEAATANGRIERFTTNPDSNSGVLTQPRVIEAGETVTIKSGRQAILANTVVEGELVIEAGGEVFVPAGAGFDYYSASVNLTGNQTVAGVKTFTSSPIVPAPTTDFQVATKKYVDDAASVGGSGLSIGDKTKLDGIEEQATKNKTDAFLLNRSNHTGTIPISVVENLEQELANISTGGGGGEVDLTNYYDKTQTETLLSNKVDKLTGKGLSTNDFTDTFKQALELKKVQDISTDSVTKKLVVNYTDATVANLNINDIITDVKVEGATLDATTNVLTLTSTDGGANVTVDLSDFVNSGELTSALSGKADKIHSHSTSDITGLDTTLSNLATNLNNKQDTLVSGTNIKTINDQSVLGSGNLALLDATNPIITGSITEQVYNLTGTEINPTNGTIQYKTVSANTTFTESLTSGQSVILRLINANSYTITFPAITWIGVTAPTLTANCAIVLWKEQSTLYGAYVGSLV